MTSPTVVNVLPSCRSISNSPATPFTGGISAGVAASRSLGVQSGLYGGDQERLPHAAVTTAWGDGGLRGPSGPMARLGWCLTVVFRDVRIVGGSISSGYSGGESSRSSTRRRSRSAPAGAQEGRVIRHEYAVRRGRVQNNGDRAQIVSVPRHSGTPRSRKAWVVRQFVASVPPSTRRSSRARWDRTK